MLKCSFTSVNESVYPVPYRVVKCSTILVGKRVVKDPFLHLPYSDDRGSQRTESDRGKVRHPERKGDLKTQRTGRGSPVDDPFDLNDRTPHYEEDLGLNIPFRSRRTTPDP